VKPEPVVAGWPCLEFGFQECDLEPDIGSRAADRVQYCACGVLHIGVVRVQQRRQKRLDDAGVSGTACMEGKEQPPVHRHRSQIAMTVQIGSYLLGQGQRCLPAIRHVEQIDRGPDPGLQAQRRTSRHRLVDQLFRESVPVLLRRRVREPQHGGG